MEQLIHAFGIDGKLIIIQIINFAVLAGLLTYFLYTPLLRILNEREEKIKKGIADAEDSAKAKAESLREKQAVLTEAQAQAQAIDARAQAFGKEKEAEMLKVAEGKAQEMLADAELKSAQLKEKAHKDSEAEIAKIAILAAQKVLQG